MKNLSKIGAYLVLIVFGFIMIYPLLWMAAASFRSNAEIYTSIGLIPKRVIWDGFVEGWKGSGQFTFGTFYANSFLLVVPTVIGTVVSSVLVAYGFTRFQFPLKKVLLAVMIATLMLPHAVLIIPRYLLFRNFGWLDSYLPFVVPAFLGGYPFFIFMMVQFIRGLPSELDESAKIDGCNSFTILTRILMPLCKPALFSVSIIQFIWLWNEFFNTLIYVNSVSKFTLQLALRMSIDATYDIQWNQIMAMSLLTMLPCMIIFFLAQKHFVEGISTTGLKG
ncbi:carbohydrate ABC transporter permease [Paenibacillus sepulcri]|uniref:Carbohydrate ABC transporter permease n=2 Tax=Paenibacillus sepulcri TaxID=359917 RepID=A0ABS7C0V9_9BACL|nr:carbohydrate ABC transporter permease [Paenibacillus sepulcri]